MEYQRYIDLGFKRTEMNCSVERKRTGYSGFALERKINKKQMVCVGSGELNNPKLYIKKKDDETYHIIPISTDVVIDLFGDTKNIDTKNIDYMFSAC